MRQVLRRTLPTVAVGMLLAGCSTTTVVGTASPGAGEPVDVAADQFPITGVSDSEVDQFARNALADLETFWKATYPEFFGEEYKPLAGGYFSVDSDEHRPVGLPGDRHRLRAGVHPAGGGRGQRLLHLRVRPGRLRPGPDPGAVGQLRRASSARWSWPTSSATRCRAGSAAGRRADHRRDAGRLLRRCLDPLGGRRQRRARRDPRARARRRRPRLPAAPRPGRQRSRTTRRRTAPTSTACPASTRDSTAAWRPAATSSVTTGSSPPRSSTRRSTTEGNAPYERHRRLDHRHACRSSGGRSSRRPGPGLPGPGGPGVRRNGAGVRRHGRRGPRARVLRVRHDGLLRPDGAGRPAYDRSATSPSVPRSRSPTRSRRGIRRSCRPTTAMPPGRPSA